MRETREGNTPGVAAAAGAAPLATALSSLASSAVKAAIKLALSASSFLTKTSTASLCVFNAAPNAPELVSQLEVVTKPFDSAIREAVSMRVTSPNLVCEEAAAASSFLVPRADTGLVAATAARALPGLELLADEGRDLRPATGAATSFLGSKSLITPSTLDFDMICRLFIGWFFFSVLTSLQKDKKSWR